MKNRIPFLAAVLWLLLAALAGAQSLSDLLGPGVNLADPAQRADVVLKMQAIEKAKHDAALKLAAQRGLQRRIVLPNGTVHELAAFERGRPLYFTTHNANAAISTGANLLQAAPYSVAGSGFTVGEWDAGSARTTHQELTGRITNKNSASFADHSTHVAGTIAASGVQAAAKGMAPAVRIDSYDWDFDTSEMTSRGASYPGELGTIYLSNHSYGYISGWNYTGNASPQWEWWGTGATSTGVEEEFGKYNDNSVAADSLVASLPYYLIFRSAGNDRADNPGTGAPVALSPGGATVTYNPAQHPPGDAVYKSGYDTIGYDAVAKNVITIGAVADAVSGGVRAPANGTITYFSSWGPTDDGRIKPDVVANGDNLYSSLATSDSAYAYYSGTSMASPNATGSALLLINIFDNLFPSQAMRASTLKALLINTADDRGNAGPDYQYGWGLINVKAAADALSAYHASPGNARVIEGRVTSTALTRTHTFTWDGVSPIRATLVWTDPAGTAITTHDSRAARLVNDLDLKVTASGGANFSPYVMPYVGDWTNAKLSAVATTGMNHTDNVEQVFIAAPSAAGVYQAVVTVTGSLTNGVQNYSLIISGSADAAAAAPSTSAVSPTAGRSGPIVLNITGANILVGATVKLTKSGQPDITATAVEALGDTVKCRADITGGASGLWNVVVTNPDGQSATLANGFSIPGPLWQEDFESGATGWTHSASPTYTIDNWALTTAQNHSATHSYFAAGPSSKNLDDLYSPVLAIPAKADLLRLTFWHQYGFQSSRRDGGVLEFSIEGGAWFDVTATGAGASFVSGGYNGALNSTSNPLNARQAWTGTNTTAFTQVILDLTDTAKYAGKSLQMRWRLATNTGTASTGWWIDDVALTGVTSANLAPSIVTDADAAPSPVTRTTTALSVAASDDAGEPALTYTWSYTGGSFLTPVSFSENGTNAAKAATATFTAAGDYSFTVTVRDAGNLSATSSVDVVVEQTPTSVAVSPASATIGKFATQLFTASVLDQFGAALSPQPAVAWSASGGGSIAADGTFTASTVGGPFTITATSGALSGNASVTITGETLTHWQDAHFTPAEISAGLAAATADPDGDGLTNLLERSLGLDPRAANVLPAVALDATGHLTLTLTRPKALPGITYIGEAGNELGSWPTSVPIEILADGDPQTIRLTDPFGTADDEHRFLRLRVTSP